MMQSFKSASVSPHRDSAFFALITAYDENKRNYREMTDEQERGLYGEAVDAEFDLLSERLATWDVPFETRDAAVAALRFVFEQNGAIACSWSEALLRCVLGFLENLPNGDGGDG